YPRMKKQVLDELLIPHPPVYGPPQNRSFGIRKDGFDRYLSQLTPFERMSLIAERYTSCPPGDKSLKSNQLNIIGTVFWLMTVLK
ncbi:MAG TPA: hypothetical protein VI758_06500, partial [Bacteroidota bacterium]